MTLKVQRPASEKICCIDCTAQCILEIYIREKGDESQQPPDECLFFWRASQHKTHGRQLASQRRRGCRGAYVMMIEGAEKQAGWLWDKFGMKEVVKEKCDMLYVGVGHHHSQGNGMCLSRAKKACVLWKLEGDISVSEGEIPSEFGR